ncbi:Heterochromatin protein 1 [Orchesella cincta]|uniref:Heterochromatin protein 1 n=1 Tax=Orchesella cincta TaxID=48709 RepID=A0A1D2MR67_ORCCI|nr:Heterochromatin protein 1 [Orchesella cincta]
MARAAPKSKKRPAPKQKKVEKKEEEEVDIKDEEHQEDLDNGNEVNNVSDAADEDEPPVKKGRGRPAGKAKGSKKAASTKKPAARGRPAASSSGRKSASKKEEEEKDDSSEDDAEYEVEKILSMRKVKGGREFQIKWKGYSKAKSTWEPEENLNCNDLIKEFEETEKEKPVRSLRAVPKETQRYVDTADLKYEGSKRHSNRLGKSPRKTYREAEED